MSPVTLPSSRTLLLCACAERPRPSYSFFFFRFRCQPEMPPDAGHGKRESAPATIPGCHVWPVFQPAAGKRGFPLSVAPPFRFSCGALRHFTYFPLFLSVSPSVCQCPHAAIPDGISGHFRCRGKGKDGIRNTNFLATISTLRRLR